MHSSIEAALIGRLGTEPELRTSSAGNPWARFSVAVGRDENLQWVQIAAFGDLAQEIVERVAKGDRVYLEGNLTLRTWEKDGKSYTGLNVAATKVEALGKIGKRKPAKANEARDDGPPTPAVRDWQRPSPEANQYAAAKAGDKINRQPDDEIPF